MKVYELMTALSKIESGKDVQVSICITKDELEEGNLIDQDLYSLCLKAFDIEDGTDRITISTEL